MRATYRFLAYAIDALIMLQAAMIAWAIFGLGVWIDDGNSLTKATMESDTFKFTEERGFMVHGINGQMVIPLIGLILLIVSFFAKVPGGVKWAAFVFLDIVLQVALGLLGHGLPALGILHGVNALVLFGLAFTAARRVSTATAVATEHEAAAAR